MFDWPPHDWDSEVFHLFHKFEQSLESKLIDHELAIQWQLIISMVG